MREENNKNPRITVIICTLNEEENLPRVLPKIPDWVDEVLLVDGYSTDNTVEVAKRLRQDIRILYQPGKGKGKGNALRYGVERASGDIIVTLDADGETNPDYMERFIAPLLKGYDLAKGSRFASGWTNKPLHRLLGNYVIAKTCNILYHTNFTDLCCGYNAFWRNALMKINPWAKDDWNYEPLIIAKALKRGLMIAEVFYPYEDRVSGPSKLPNWKQGLTSIWVLVKERFRC